MPNPWQISRQRRTFKNWNKGDLILEAGHSYQYTEDLVKMGYFLL